MAVKMRMIVDAMTHTATATVAAPKPALPVARANAVINKVDGADKAFHDWYRFVLSFPPHLVRDYVERFDLVPGQTLLDPFSGTGTTVLEAKLNGIDGIGLEANPMAHFAGVTKTTWNSSPGALRRAADKVADAALQTLRPLGLADEVLNPVKGEPSQKTLRALLTLPPEADALLLKRSISPIPLHKALVLRDAIDSIAPLKLRGMLRLALARELVSSISNLHFGPEVGVRGYKTDVPAVAAWRGRVEIMADDLERAPELPIAESHIALADARSMTRHLEPQSIDCVFTSPPYPNEKDYTRTTRLESVVLGFVNDKPELRALKKSLLRSNTRGVYKGDDDDALVSGFQSVQTIAREIERRRIAMNKTSGFERMYARVTKLYFGGMARHLADLRPFLKHGARLGYVVGDQASYLQVMIRTGQLLAEIAESLGYRVDNIDLFRTRLATATKQQIREEVLILTWPGK